MPAPLSMVATAPATASPFAVTRLTLTDFRNFEALRLDCGERMQALVGPNGAGKTNLLEALSLLAPGRGLRRAALGDLCRRGTGTWSIAADIETDDGPRRLGTGVAVSSERREVRLDGAPLATSAQLDDVTGAVWLVPAMDRLLGEGSPPRRRFMDRLVHAGDPAHARQLRLYDHLLRERSQVLRSNRADPAWLSSLEQQLSAAGVAIAAARLEVIAELNHRLRARVSPFPMATLAVSGTLERALAESAAIDVEERFAETLAQNRQIDAQTGGTAEGPHRSDLDVVDLDQGVAAAGQSTGRQKALLIGLMLAECRLFRDRKGFWPLLLLDEIGAHLDKTRRDQLAGELREIDAQIWLTGTEADLFTAFAGDARFLHVDHARIQSDVV